MSWPRPEGTCCCPVAIKGGVRNPELGPTARRLAELTDAPRSAPSDLLGATQALCCPPHRPCRAGEEAHRVVEAGSTVPPSTRGHHARLGALEADVGLSRCSGDQPYSAA